MKKTVKGLFVGAAAVATVASLSACVPGNADKAKSKLEKDGYTVSVASVDTTGGKVIIAGIEASTGAKNVKEFVSAIKGSETVSAIYFQSSSDAKDVYEKIKNDTEKDEKMVCKRSGKIIYAGTEEAIKAFK